MTYPSSRLFSNTGKPGTWFSVEDFLNELKTVLVNSSTEKVLGVAILDQNGNQVTPVASTATLSNVSGSASSVTLLAANTSRKMAMFYNDSTAILYLKFGATASTSSFTVKLMPEAYYEMVSPVYSGLIAGIWDSATGACRVTELT